MNEKLKILVIDDNKEFCQNIKDVLELKNLNVETAFDGLKGLDMVKEHDFDLTLLDIKMPIMNGVETFKRIKEINPKMPVIMVTAFAVEDLIRQALREGAYGALKKPLDFDKLFSLIDNAMSKGMLIHVVDDDQALCGNIYEVLMSRGYRVKVAYDGDTAIKNAHENNFDIMLLDMKLPPINGLETYLAIRDIRPEVVVIIITGYMKEMGDLVDETLDKTAYSYIEKPIDMDRLILLLDEIKEQKNRDAQNKPG